MIKIYSELYIIMVTINILLISVVLIGCYAGGYQNILSAYTRKPVSELTHFNREDGASMFLRNIGICL
jgi:hypothetical protein